MDQFDLHEIRRRLHDWRNHSPSTLYSLLDQIGSQKLTANQLFNSKLHKTIQSLSEIDLNQEKYKPNIYNWQDYKRVIDKAKVVLRLLANSVKNEMDIEKKHPEQIKKVNLFQGFQQQFGGYVERLQYLNAISNIIVHTIQNWSQANQAQIQTVDKIIEVTLGLEKQIYTRNLYKESKKLAYEMDIRTLIQFLRRDKNGNVIIRVFNKSLSYEQASQLRSEDWIDENTKKEQMEAQKEQLEENKIGFYREVSKREMDGIEGKVCKGCKQNKVYLVDEKQTRRSDEPTTKFYECFNCGDKFRT